ncbi:3'-5' exonuclease [Planococcus lenghuensis]|uniref:DNA polymerase III subunit epsilon n=1 Tax=Planococcus lenghuensis TaxID=2213202 RepID=A0A1Q2L0H5_9BACL|nr:3'-5' exonuclease [Planococcus lenghuensis]AQQ53960.1 DNA polymerase III subunit epsilon [Planococcus lenghuensis]
MEKRSAEQLLKQKKKMQYSGSRKNRQQKYSLSMEVVKNYVVLDFETTGLSAWKDKIIQIGAVKYENHRRTDTFYLLVDPQCHISRTITSITGIRNEDVAGAPVIEEVIDDLIAFIGDYPIVAHNAPFDMGFLYALDSIASIPAYTVIDTVRLAKQTLRNIPDYKLTTLSAFLELEHHAHDALGDCLAAAAIYQFCAVQN